MAPTVTDGREGERDPDDPGQGEGSTEAIPRVLKVSMEEVDRHEEHRIARYRLNGYVGGDLGKVVLLVGATGSGKSTLVQGLVNHMSGVKWEMERRFQVNMVKESAKEDEVTESQTTWVTGYTLTDPDRPDRVLTVVDTPGFGDTGGLGVDEFILKQVRTFFKEFGIRELHAAAVVVPAPTSRLSPAENYVFNCIRQLFGKDVRDNIYLLLTFSDCERGPAADTVKEAGIPFVKHFQVNNSVLYADRAKADPLAETYWNISVEGYEGFLDEVFRVKPVSLELTKVIMEERQAWEEQFHQLHLQLDRSFKELAKFREDCKSSEPDPPGLDEKLKKLKEEIRKVMTDVDHHHAQLQGKSLNSHQMTSMDYISLMINTEVQERKPGHQDRLKLLKAVKVEDPTNSQKPEEKDQEEVLDNSKPNQGSPAQFSRLHRFWRSFPIGSGRKNQQNKVTQPQDSSILDGEYSDALDTPAQEGMQHDAGLHRGGLWRSLRRTLSGWGKRRHENRHSKTIPEEGQGQEVKEQKQEKESDVPSAEMPEAPSDRPVAQPEKSEPRTGKHNCIIL